MNFIYNLISGISGVIWAILLLVVAVIVASVVKKLVVKLLSKVHAEKVLDKAGITDKESKSSIEFVGKFCYLVVLLLFVPGIFEQLGLSQVSAPITNLLNTFLGYIPNIIAAALVLVIGFMIAKIVRQLLIPVFERIKLDKLQEKMGIEATGTNKLSSVLAYLVYALIIIPVIITALSVLKISAISAPAISMLNTVFNFIPKILVAIIVVLVGSYIAKLAGVLVEKLLATSGMDAGLRKLAPTNEGLQKFTLSKTVGTTVRVIIVLLFVVEALNVLELAMLTTVGGAIISYLPLVLSALIIMGLALFCASWLEGFILKKNEKSKVLALVSKCTVLTVGVFMTLNQLGFATEIVNAAFVLILAALAVAFAIAFGIGGRSFAERTLEKLEKKDDQK